MEIFADNCAPENIYARRVRLNGEPLRRTWIRHEEIAGGGVLRFEMAGAPGHQAKR